MFLNKLVTYKLSFILAFIPVLLIATEIPVTNKLIKKGNIIKKEDIISKDEIINNTQTILDEEIIIGSLAIKNINPYFPILPDQIKSPNLVSRNNIVDVSYQNGSIKLRTKAVAIQSGQYGSNIKLKSDDKYIVGTVTGKNKVTVHPLT